MNHPRHNAPDVQVALVANRDVGEVRVGGLQQPTGGGALQALDGQFTVDIGEGGVSFIVDTMLHKGSVTVEIPDVQLTLEGQILGYQPTSDAGLYQIGRAHV